MTHHFNEEKATQVAVFFSSRSGGQINYTKLMKLIYLSDREAFKNWGRPIVGGPYSAMEHGPLSSPAYDAVKASPASLKFPIWTSVFKKAGYDLEQIRDIELDSLSRAEIELLEQIDEKFGKMGEWDLVHYTHVNCHEWHDPQGTSVTIPEEAILEQVGRTADEIEFIADETAKHTLANRLLSKRG